MSNPIDPETETKDPTSEDGIFAAVVIILLLSILLFSSACFHPRPGLRRYPGFTPPMPPGGRGLQWRLHNLHSSPHQGIPHVKNASAQAYAFKAQATVTNTMDKDLKQ
ncbi:hypothetical protein HPP92_009879 [Vanilla planifolia]|uniref:Uncharacterized protein n=1 Tax=Vanilla planifolia TaxID=51239 RepID=A0A835V2X8_VANPL|nr:hypothetical protein HPP92_009879 [Vanilla planifolia]